MIGVTMLLASFAQGVDHPLPREGSPRTATETSVATEAAAAALSIERAQQYLLDTQNPDGSWGTSTVESLFEIEYSNASFYSWKVAGAALAFMAMARVEDPPRVREAMTRTLEWLLAARPPQRGNDWDIDSNWAHLYCFQALVEAARDGRFAQGDLPERVRAGGLAYYDRLEKNQDPLGGWGYYEGAVISRRPTWSTSFATACVIPSLVEAKSIGWPIDARVTHWAVKYVKRCRLPSGAFEYSLSPIPRFDGGEHIDDVKGSLSRIQVCNWALCKAGEGEVSPDWVRQGVEAFFREHKFLFVARLKPIPHEAYYRNAGYFYYFGHYYAAEMINQLPVEEREGWHARLRTHLVRTQRTDGSFLDFPGSTYVPVACTAFAIMALEAGLP